MMTILKENDLLAVEKLCVKSGIDYKENISAFVAKETNEVLGYILYEASGDRIDILYAEYGQDKPLFDGLVRSVFFSETQFNDNPAYFSEKIDRNLLNEYGYIGSEQNYIESMDKFLSVCKNCKNRK